MVNSSSIGISNAIPNTLVEVQLGYKPDYVYVFAGTNLVWYYNKLNSTSSFYTFNGTERNLTLNTDNRGSIDYPFNLFVTDCGFKYSYQYADCEVTYFAGELNK